MRLFRTACQVFERDFVEVVEEAEEDCRVRWATGEVPKHGFEYCVVGAFRSLSSFWGWVRSTAGVSRVNNPYRII